RHAGASLCYAAQLRGTENEIEIYRPTAAISQLATREFVGTTKPNAGMAGIEWTCGGLAMKFPHTEMPLDDLCSTLHKQGSTWFNNRDLLLLEELIRRAKAGATEKDDGRHQQSVRDIPAPTADVRGDQSGGQDPAGL